MTFYSLWWLLLGAGLAITTINGVFLYRVYKTSPALLDELGRPTPFFFVTGGWLTSRRFTKFLLSAKSRAVLNPWPDVLMLARILAVMYVSFLLILLMTFVSLLLDR